MKILLAGGNPHRFFISISPERLQRNWILTVYRKFNLKKSTFDVISAQDYAE
jgi:hypothetical protein